MGLGSWVGGGGNTLFLLFPTDTPAPSSAAVSSSAKGVVGIRFTVETGRRGVKETNKEGRREN